MSVEDCPDCRKLQSECEALERELNRALHQVRHGDYLHGLVSWMVAATHSPPDSIPVEFRNTPQVADILALRRVAEPDPRAPKPVYVPAAVPAAQPRHPDRYCAICDRVHES